MSFAIPLHSAWATGPLVSSGFQRMWKRDHFVDRFAAYIVGIGIDGKRYCRAVEVTGRAMEDGSAQKRLEHVLAIVTQHGPYLCDLIEEGGSYPHEADQTVI